MFICVVTSKKSFISVFIKTVKELNLYVKCFLENYYIILKYIPYFAFYVQAKNMLTFSTLSISL